MYVCMHAYKCTFVSAPRGFPGDLRRRAIFFREWRALVIIFRELGSKLMVLGSLAKSKFINLTLKERPSFCLIKMKIFGFWGVGVRAVASPVPTCKMQM